MELHTTKSVAAKSISFSNLKGHRRVSKKCRSIRRYEHKWFGTVIGEPCA